MRTATTTTIMEKQKAGSKAGNRGDWRSQTLARIRMLIKQADPEVVGL
jgi:hypothetical protein